MGLQAEQVIPVPASSIDKHWVQNGTYSVQRLQVCPLVFLKYPTEQVVQVDATMSQVSQKGILAAQARQVLSTVKELGAHLVH